MVAASAATALLCPAPAQAARVGIEAGELLFEAASGETNDATIALEGAVYRLTDTGAQNVTPDPGSGCTNDPPGDVHTVTCPATGIVKLSVGAQDGDDRVVIDAPTPALILTHGGADEITGGSGDDQIFGMAEGDTVHAGAGNDLLLELDSQSNVLDGGPGVDQITGGLGPDQVFGGPGDDVRLFGGEGNDLIDGGEGDDVLEAGPGPTVLHEDGDKLDGGPGNDLATYVTRANPVRASMADGANDGTLGERDDIAADIERLAGSQGSDELIGSAASDLIDGGGGADLVIGGAGSDRLDGGPDDAGGDTLRGGPDDDTLEGRAGGDRLDGDEGGDSLSGGTDGDRLEGGDGRDRLDAGEGDDRLDGGLDGDILSGGDGEDTVAYTGRSRPVEVTIDDVANDGETIERRGRTRTEEGAISEGDDVDATNERVTGGTEDDTVAGSRASNTLEGAAGEDYLVGRLGADTLSGGGRNDTIVSRDGRIDRVSCGAGYDYVVADGRDLLPRGNSRCEYVDDGSRSRPAARRDIAIQPSCGRRDDADADMSLPGMGRAVPVKQRVLAPLGSRVDSFDCAVRLRVAVGERRVRAGTLGTRTGTMRFGQRRAGRGRLVTTMRPTDCRRPGQAARTRSIAARHPRGRYRRKFGRIAFPVEVHVDAAVISNPRGIATWEVKDVCGRFATVTVSSGRLAVLDLGRDRRVVVEPGKPYTALAR